MGVRGEREKAFAVVEIKVGRGFSRGVYIYMDSKTGRNVPRPHSIFCPEIRYSIESIVPISCSILSTFGVAA